MYRSTRQRARVNLVPSSILRHGVSWMIVFLWSAFRVKFPHSTILLHSVLGLRKQWQKKYIAIEKTDFFYNCMGLLGNFTAFSRVKKVGWCDIRRTVKQSLERIHRINDTKVLSIRPRLFSVFVCLIVFGFIYFCTQRLLGNPLLQMVWV